MLATQKFNCWGLFKTLSCYLFPLSTICVWVVYTGTEFVCSGNSYQPRKQQ